LIRLKTDLSSVFDSIHKGALGEVGFEWVEGASACVVAANRGYPGRYETGAEIEGLDAVDQGRVQVFHAGTSLTPNGKFIATGGRVLGIAAADETLRGALDLCYGALQKIHWPGVQFRTDIGRARGIER
jgi:phosphoribosylamine--glycine ligase